jgi:hypothetical protein
MLRRNTQSLVRDKHFYFNDDGSTFLRQLVSTYQTTCSYNPTAHNMNLHRCENLRSYKPSTEAAPQLKQLVAGFPPRRPGFVPGSGQVGFVVRFSPSTSVSPAILHSIKFSILTITWGRYNRPEVADVPSGPSLDSTPHYAY